MNKRVETPLIGALEDYRDTKAVKAFRNGSVKTLHNMILLKFPDSTIYIILKVL